MDKIAAIFFFIFFGALFLNGVNSECELFPKDHPVMVKGIECQKKFGTKIMCVGDCAVRALGFMDENGKGNREAVEEAFAKEPESELKSALWEVWEKCFKNVTSIDRSSPTCSGFLKVGKCGLKIMRKRCPKVVKMFGMN